MNVWICWKEVSSQFLKIYTVKSLMFNGYIGVITQWAGSRGFYISSFQMAVEGDVSCSEAECSVLVLSLDISFHPSSRSLDLIIWHADW